MSVRELFHAENALTKLMTQTLGLVRVSKDPRTMKNYLHCYDILDLTNELNKPWAEHPGFVYGDMGAFIDLELTCKEIIFRLDPDPRSVKIYVLDITRFLIFWKKVMDNKTIRKHSASIK
jgi:hypothetical protein